MAIDKAQFTQALLIGLNSVPKRGTPGTIVPFGDSAFCAVTSHNNDCVAGAAVYGSGRAVAMTHNGYLLDVTPNSNDDNVKRLNRFIRNSVMWAAKAECEFMKSSKIDQEMTCGPFCENKNFDFVRLYPFGADRCRMPIAVAGLGMTSSKLQSILEGIGEGSSEKFVAVAAEAQTTSDSVVKVLEASPDVVLWTNGNTKQEVTENDVMLDERAEMLLHFTQQGGGVVVGLCPWGWNMLSGGSNLESRCVFNHYLERVGLTMTEDYAGGDVGGVYSVKESVNRSEIDNAATTLAQTVSALRSRSVVDKDTLKSCLKTFLNLPSSLFLKPKLGRNGYLPPSDDGIRSEVAMVTEFALNVGAPALQFPITLKGDLDFRKVASYLYIPELLKLWQHSPVDECPVAQPYDTMPGPIDPTAPRSEYFLFTLNPKLKGIQTTGIYVPPGEVVTVTLSDQALQTHPNLKLRVQIGCHKDQLKIVDDNDDNYQLRRHPRIVSYRDWTPKVVGPPDGRAFCTASPPTELVGMKAATPFGGLLYIWLLEGYSAGGAPLTVNIAGGLRAPIFNLQKEFREVPWSSMTDSYPHGSMSWRDRVNEYSGVPWGELEGRYLIFTVDTESLKKIEDPVKILEFWDSALAHELALSGQQLDQKERIVADVQIGGGWLHSGYPIMAHRDIYDLSKNGVPQVLDLDHVKSSPSWGLYHEMGHNRQKGEWTFEGCTEVTVNIFSLYCTQMLNGKKPYQAPYYVENCRDVAMKYLQSDSQSFAGKWQKDCNVALATYIVFIEEFGWKAMADVMRKYETLPQDKKPKSNTDKITEWIRQTSLITGQDLRPYYSQWKWPVDNSKLSGDLDNLPEWTKDVLDVIKAN